MIEFISFLLQLNIPDIVGVIFWWFTFCVGVRFGLSGIVSIFNECMFNKGINKGWMWGKRVPEAK